VMLGYTAHELGRGAEGSFWKILRPADKISRYIGLPRPPPMEACRYLEVALRRSRVPLDRLNDSCWQPPFQSTHRTWRGGDLSPGIAWMTSALLYGPSGTTFRVADSHPTIVMLGFQVDWSGAILNLFVPPLFGRPRPATTVLQRGRVTDLQNLASMPCTASESTARRLSPFPRARCVASLMSLAFPTPSIRPQDRHGIDAHRSNHRRKRCSRCERKHHQRR
jgi:hypothetical protein